MIENVNIEMNAGVQYGIQMLEQMPKGDRIVMEEHITGVLVVFWGALWGSFGTEFARGFIESQLLGMETDVPNERYVQATVQ